MIKMLLFRPKSVVDTKYNLTHVNCLYFDMIVHLFDEI